MKAIQPSFTGGELSPSLWARVDLARYGVSLKTCRNFIVSSYGGIYNRPGTRYIAPAGNGAFPIRLIPFSFNNEQTYIIELGNQYARFYSNGGQVVSGGSPVQITTPWTSDDIWDVRYTQSADTVYLVHQNYPPQVLTRTGASTFTIQPYTANDGPFQPLNPSTANIMASSGTSGNVTLTSNADVFESNMVGQLVYIANQNLASVKPWTSGEKNVPVGSFRSNAGCTYRCDQVSTGGTYYLCGGNAPDQNEGSQWDGPGDVRFDGTDNYSVGVLWTYVDCGYGVAQITGYVSPTEVNALVILQFPQGVVGGAGSPSQTWTFTGDGSTTTFNIAGATGPDNNSYSVKDNGTPIPANPNQPPTGGGGPITNCVEEHSFLPGGYVARMLTPARCIACVDHATLDVHWDPMRHLSIATEPCWKITSESGTWLIISKGTRCETKEQGYVYGDQLEGLSLPCGGDDLVLAWEVIVRVEDAGLCRVARIDAGDRNYLAGGEKGRYISTHNMIAGKQ